MSTASHPVVPAADRPRRSRRQRTAGAVALASALALGLAACGDDGDSSAAAATGGGGDKLKVVATTAIVADFARNVGGDRVEVTQILQPNVDPHDFEPSPADIVAIGEAEVVVENGVGLEHWLDDTISASGFDGTLVDSSEGVEIHEGSEEGHAEEEHADEHAEEEHAEEEHAHEEGDPHIWHNPQNAKLMVANIEKAFAAADAEDAGAYAANAAAYSEQIDQLDADNKRKLETIPAADRKLVTNHDAFGYYVEHYGLTFVGSIIPSFDSSAELSGADVNALVDEIKASGVKAVFSESSLPPRTAESIAERAGVEVVAGEDALYGDALGPQGSAGDTYLKAEAHNTDTIVAALGG
ncbi:metal ABC transporter substrate-binding protein [Motilibacter aurantiacus]|uniref:metal ABC transporter substrate-binding protein n=1 Tax=Motilibacter aurantiacus TaxID=2714955 RepID=UPI001407BE6C|nr:metal ABC transporter substrate-binding protein [Motilibacter aurantiacus]NHC44114.1 zinc ABC transporter solute-binding protein [Motilibacter aurantiacus]